MAALLSALAFGVTFAVGSFAGGDGDEAPGPKPAQVVEDPGGKVTEVTGQGPAPALASLSPVGTLPALPAPPAAPAAPPAAPPSAPPAVSPPPSSSGESSSSSGE